MNFNVRVFFLLHLSKLVIELYLPVGNLELLSILTVSHIAVPHPIELNRSSKCKNHPHHPGLPLLSIELFGEKRQSVLKELFFLSESKQSKIDSKLCHFFKFFSKEHFERNQGGCLGGPEPW